MYVPILKNRLYENKFLREHFDLFSEKITPLIEVITLVFGRSEKSIEEMIQIYDNYFYSPYFIDFFAFSHDEYQQFDSSQVDLSLKIRDEAEFKYFDDLLFEASRSMKAIPVVSIKRARDFILSKSVMISTIQKVQKCTSRMAVRIDSNLLDQFYDTLHPLLRKDDFLLYDIREDTIESKFFDLQAISQKKKDYKTIILNSPRPSKLKNGSYKDCAFTGLIDNSIRETYLTHGFDGYGDYAGLKDVLPTDGGNGKGAALGLFFVDEYNKFY